MEAALALAERGEQTLLIGCHDMNEAALLARRVALLHRGRILTTYILANALFEGLQLLALLSIVTWAGHPQPVGVLWVLVCYVAALVAANATGVLVALIVGGLSGLFMASMPGPLREVGLLLPFRHFRDSLLRAWGTASLRFAAPGPPFGRSFALGGPGPLPRLFRFR